MRYINIGNRKVGAGQRVFIIAEIGVNHNGSLKLAKGMVDGAKACGADAAKFQTFKTEDLLARDIRHKSQFEMLKQLELSEGGFRTLSDYCRKKKIIFLSTPFDYRSACFLYRLGVPAFKIGSGELTNTPLLLQVAGYRRPIILSTGMATLREVREAVRTVYSTNNKDLILLHCTSNYPAKYSDVNLRAMDTLRERFGAPVGYSDHTEGIEASIAAVTMGACVIEKHFTLDKGFRGPDHKASLEPDEFRDLVRAIRNTEEAMGDGVKTPRDSEQEVKKLARKSIVAACDISKGGRLNLDMLAVKRPGTGLAPKYLKKLVNKKAMVDIKKDQVLTRDEVCL